MRVVARGATTLLFLATGTLHFLRASTFVQTIPLWLPHPMLLVIISGICELAGAVGLLLPRTRTIAAWGLIALLIAVFPANLHMALHPAQFAAIATPAQLWWRLPIQPLLILLVWYGALKPEVR